MPCGIPLQYRFRHASGVLIMLITFILVTVLIVLRVLFVLSIPLTLRYASLGVVSSWGGGPPGCFSGAVILDMPSRRSSVFIEGSDYHFTNYDFRNTAI